MTPPACPNCGADLTAPGGYFRVIGVEVRGVYDGVLHWLCPDCGHTWHRWPDGHPYRQRAEPYVAPSPEPTTEEASE